LKRGELYRVRSRGADPKRSRVFVVVSRETLIRSRFPTLICAPVHSRGESLATQVAVGTGEGLKHESWILCDGLVSMPRVLLTDYVGSLGPTRLAALDRSLKVALALD
jgi:mRNA interferase MazF